MNNNEEIVDVRINLRSYQISSLKFLGVNTIKLMETSRFDSSRLYRNGVREPL